MDAIVYTSNTGYTKQYADLLGKKLSLPVYTIPEAKKSLSKKSEVIYLGWICKGKVVDYKKATAAFDLKAVIGVGMSIEDDEVAAGLKKQTKITQDHFFYVQGGFNFNALKGMNRFVMKQFRNTMIPRFEQRNDLDDAQMNMLKMMRDGGNAVSIDRLAPVIEWSRKFSGE